MFVAVRKLIFELFWKDPKASLEIYKSLRMHEDTHFEMQIQ